MNEATIRKGKYTSKYVTISNKVAQDRTMSYEALGLLTNLLSRPDDWEVRISDLHRPGTGRGRVYRIIKELVELGYIEPRRKYQDARTKQWNWTPYYVYSEPCAEKPYTASRDTETRIRQTVTYTNQESTKQETKKDSPQHANATAGQQGANHASLPMESSLLETDALTDAPAKEPIPLEENISPDPAPMPEQQAPAEPSPLEEVKPMESGAPEKKARKLTPAQLRSNALLTALGTAPDMATKAEGRRAGQVAGELNTIYKRARGEDMTPEDVTAFVEYVKKQAGGQWTVTANSLLMNGRFAGWMEARAKAAVKPAPVASSAAYDELMSLRGA